MCVECDLAEPESLASLGGSAPGLSDGILSRYHCLSRLKWTMLVQYGWQIIVVCQRGQSMLI